VPSSTRARSLREAQQASLVVQPQPKHNQSGHDWHGGHYCDDRAAAKPSPDDSTHICQPTPDPHGINAQRPQHQRYQHVGQSRQMRESP
jgi:hypothetical protein